MFHRQSMMFVACMKTCDEDEFRSFLLDIEDGAAFAKAYNKSYPIRLEELWDGFIREVESRD